MRLFVLLLALGALAACATSRPAVPPGPRPAAIATNHPPTITPVQSIIGRVTSVNNPGRFVVLTFPLGTMPSAGKRLNVYRAGLKVGEIRVSGAPLDTNIIADILAGDCQRGDAVRDD